MVMLGAFLEATKAVEFESIVYTLKKKLPAHRQNLMPMNEEALKAGAAQV